MTKGHKILDKITSRVPLLNHLNQQQKGIKVAKGKGFKV